MGNAIQFGIYRKLIAILLIVFISLNVSAQKVVVEEGAYTTDRLEAYEYIDYLKKGTLIVRLRINTKKVAAYRSVGNEALALKLEEQQRKRNEDMMLAFTSNFDFCEVLFIYADDFDKVLNGETKGFFVNENLERDTTIVLNNLNYLFCDFGPVYVQAIDNQIDPKNKVVTSTMAYSDALVIKGLDMVQLLDPFPYAAKVRFYEFDKAAGRLNDSLYKFYAKSWAKKN